MINVPALNYLLRSQIFVNDDGQLRAAHLILDYEPISRTFLDVGNSIRANDYHLARIDVDRKSTRLNSRFLTIWFFYLRDKTQTNPRISLINVPALNYLLRSQIFVNDDGQPRAAHLILDHEPISRTFLDVGNSIRANDYRLARIDVSRPDFLAPHNLPLVDHPVPQGIPLTA